LLRKLKSLANGGDSEKKLRTKGRGKKGSAPFRKGGEFAGRVARVWLRSGKKRENMKKAAPQDASGSREGICSGGVGLLGGGATMASLKQFWPLGSALSLTKGRKAY